MYKNQIRRYKFVVYLLLVLLGSVNVAFAAPVEVTETAEELSIGSGSSYVLYCYSLLVQKYYDPTQLNTARLLNAALNGISQRLDEHAITFHPKNIDEGMPAKQAMYQFTLEFERAIILAQKSSLELHLLEFSAVAAMLESVGDSHTYFLDPAQYQRQQEYFERESNRFGGIGVALGYLEDGYTYFEAVFPGGPADKAGAEDFDQLIAINGVSIPKDQEAIVSQLRGPPGTVVNLTLCRRGKQFKVRITREEIVARGLDCKILHNGQKNLLLLRLYVFSPGSIKAVEDCLTEIAKRGTHLDGVIVDLRSNGGGYIESLNIFLDLFFGAGKEMYILRSNQENESWKTHFPAKVTTPMVVLINHYSASASEIFAGIVQEQCRGTIVGTTSMGAVSVGETVELPYATAMLVTIKQFFTAAGKSLEKVGVTPDVVVDLTKDDIINQYDAPLEKAIEILNQ